MEELKKYIKYWNEAPSPKPSNEPKFYTLFLEFLEGDVYWEFSGENGYCGRTATVSSQPMSLYMDGVLNFELAYGNQMVKVFDFNHNGFWIPEYIDMSGEESFELLEIIKKELNKWGGF